MTNKSLDTVLKMPENCNSNSNYEMSVYNCMKAEAGFNPVKRVMAWLIYKMDEAMYQKRINDLEKKGYRQF